MGVFDPFLGGDFGVFTLSLPTSGGILGPFWGGFWGFLGGPTVIFGTFGHFSGGAQFGGGFSGFLGYFGSPSLSDFQSYSSNPFRLSLRVFSLQLHLVKYEGSIRFVPNIIRREKLLVGCDSYSCFFSFISFYVSYVSVLVLPPEYNGKAPGTRSEIPLLTLPVGWVGGPRSLLDRNLNHVYGVNLVL